MNLIRPWPESHSPHPAKSLKVAGNIRIYTNQNIVLEKLGGAR
jgi:ATP-dependent protease HslVU (ClpYQ) peptidase subunit